MITHSYKKLFKKLDKSKLEDAQTIQNPIVSVDLGDGTARLAVGGDFCIVHYSRQKEIAHSVQRLQKRFRTLRKQQARCNTGDNLPSPELRLNWEGELNG